MMAAAIIDRSTHAQEMELGGVCNTSGSKGPMFGQLCDLVRERGSI